MFYEKVIPWELLKDNTNTNARMYTYIRTHIYTYVHISKVKYDLKRFIIKITV